MTRAERPSLPNLKEQGSNELAQRFMQYISDSNFEQADTLIDFAGYANRVAKLVFDTERQQKLFVSGFKEGLQNASLASDFSEA